VRSAGSGRAASVRLFFLACLVVAALATVGGVLFYAIHGNTTLTRAIAYGFWVAATLTLVAMILSGSRGLARRGLPQVEGWVFVSAAFLLTAIGAVVDALGSV
jgi:Na+/H+-translocating membrane pyrophosphatase